jgi:serine/threonine protein kinase
MNFFRSKETDKSKEAEKRVMSRTETITAIGVPRYRIRANVVEYIVECTGVRSSWQICRRYQQFKVLHSQLAGQCTMGTPHHCEEGALPSLLTGKLLEVTNENPERVERRRRYLEIYLQQLMVPGNKFYPSCACLVNFLHDDENPIFHSKSTRLIPGLGFPLDAEPQLRKEQTTLNTLYDDPNDEDAPPTSDGAQRQCLASRPSVDPLSTAVAPSIPDFLSQGVTKTHATPFDGSVPFDSLTAGAGGVGSAPASMRPRSLVSGSPAIGPMRREKCNGCGAISAIDYDFADWASWGRCTKCNNFTEHEVLEDEAAAEGIASGGLPCSSDDDDDDDDEEGEADGSPVEAEGAKPCCCCNIDLPLFGQRFACIECRKRYCGSCAVVAQIADGESICGECRVAAKSRSSDIDVSAPGSHADPMSPPPALRVTEEEEPIFSENVRLGDFDLITTLGRGTFGKVMKVRHRPTDGIFAMKVLSKAVVYQRRMVDYIREEKAILADMRGHPFVVKLHFAFQTEHHLFFVLDYLPGGELYSHIHPQGAINENVARFYIAEVILGIEHVHKHDVCHRDLKPENVVLDGDGHAVITDFGLARARFSRQKRRSFVGSAEYIAPETVRCEVQTKAMDWWSVGIMLYEMLVGRTPFNAETNNKVYSAVIHRPLDLAKPTLSRDATNLLARLLDKDPRTRLQDASRLKAHPFFAGLDWEALARKEIVPPFVPDLSHNDTKYFSREFTSEWAGIQQVGAFNTVNVELLTQRFSNFTLVKKDDDESRASAAAAAAAASPLPSAVSFATSLVDHSQFYGVWRLLRVEMRGAGGKVSFPWGAEVAGLLTYTEAGLFSMQMSPMKRSKFKSGSKTNRDEMADAFLGYVAAFGSFHLLPGKAFIVHRLTAALCPAMVRSEMKRYFEITESTLQLTTPCFDVEGGMKVQTVSMWERVVAP